MMLGAALMAASLVMTQAQSDAIDTVVGQVMQANHIAGLSLGVSHNGQTLILRGYGLRDSAGHQDADGDTVYRIGSLTKQFTAALVLQQVESDHLKLDTRVHGATIEQLLAQTSGIANYAPGSSVESALAARPLFAPGTQWSYSNTNYYLLGKTLQSSTGTDFSDLLNGKILKPLQLGSTSLDLPTGSNVATGYEWNDGAYIAVQREGVDDPIIAFSAAGMSSSARDLLVWLDGLRTGKVVSADDFAAMASTKSLNDGSHTHYGYGFYVRNWYGWRTAEHSGNVDGYSSDDAIVVDDGLDIAILSNADSVSLAPLSKSIVAILEPAKDENLVADAHHPAENEDQGVTLAIRGILQQLQTNTLDRSRLTLQYDVSLTPEYLHRQADVLGPLGAPTAVEFIGRTSHSGVTYEKYRLTFAYQQYWMTLGYTEEREINSILIEPDED